MFRGVTLLLTGFVLGMFAQTPSSTNYTLKKYDIGGGGTSGSSSTNYKVNGVSGSQSGSTSSSTNYKLKSGESQTLNSNVPPAPTFTNPSSYYDKLKLVIATGNNPSDAKFAIAISADNFASDTRYVKSDSTVGPTLALTDYQTYTNWGGASGFLVLGLLPSTTYTVKVKAMQGTFTESPYGPTASVATVAPSLTFSVATSSNTIPPFSVNFSGLSAGTVFASNDDLVANLTTNANNGGYIYVKDANNGLTSTSSGYTLSSATTDLATASTGYGAQVSSTTQASGGPLASVSPYASSSDNVGGLSSILVPFVSTSGPVTTGVANLRLKAKTDVTVPAAADYTDTITLIAAMFY